MSEPPAEKNKVAAQALVPLARNPVVPVLPAGEVSLALQAGKRRFFSSELHAEIVNASTHSMICIARGLTARGERAVRGSDTWIDASTNASLMFRVPAGMRTVTVRLLGGAAEYRADSVVPRPWIVELLRLFGALAIAAIVAFTATLLAKPRIDALAVPAGAIAGDPVDVSYAARGAGELRYAVSERGRVVAAGVLHADSGRFAFATDRRPRTYEVRIDKAGFAGAATAERAVTTRALPGAPQTASIRSLSAQPAVPAEGTPFVARYVSNGTTGNVALVDEHGITWSAGIYSTNGMTTFIAPHVDKPTHFIVSLQVGRGASSATASTGVVVMPAPKPSPTSAALPDAAILTEPQYVVGGLPFEVRLHSQSGAVLSGRVALQNAAGKIVASTSVTPNAPVSLIAPPASRTLRYYLVATATKNKSSQLLVTPVDVHPAR